jgi:uncharacterized protein with FMN-binding domain
MGAKRGLLIGVGTLGSLGAVLAITPPQFGSSASGGLSGGVSTGTSGTAATTTSPAAAAPAATQAAATTPAPAATTATKKKSAKKTTTKSSNANTSGNATASTPAATATTAAPAPAATKAAAPASSGASGTYTGGVYQAVEPNGRVWGNVQVTVTLSNGVISAISGAQSPSSRGGYAFSQMDPYVQAHKISISTITSASAGSLPYVSQATYSSMAYWESLQSALKKAGL